MTIKDELKALREKATSMGYIKEAEIIASALAEITTLQDELTKTQTQLRAREEGDQ